MDWVREKQVQDGKRAKEVRVPWDLGRVAGPGFEPKREGVRGIALTVTCSLSEKS